MSGFTVVAPIDGLLRNDQGGPFMTGQMLYRALAGNYRMVLSSPVPVPDAEAYMRRQGLLGWSRIHELPLLKAVAFERVESSIQFVITPDEEEARAVFAQGITVMLISGSDFVNPKWRPERQSWGKLLQDLEQG